MNLKGKHALIYGATGGIGRAVMTELIAEGVQPYLIGRSQKSLEDLAVSFDIDPAAIICCDSITTEEDMDKVSHWLTQTNRVFQIGIHAVGKGLMKPAARLTLAEWKALIDVNLTSAFSFYKLFSSVSDPQGFELVYFSTASLNRDWPKNALYGASKSGLEAFSRSLQQEIKPIGGRVWLYRAGSIHTGFFDSVKNHLPFHKMITPEQIARLVVSNFKQPTGIYFPVIPVLSE